VWTSQLAVYNLASHTDMALTSLGIRKQVDSQVHHPRLVSGAAFTGCERIIGDSQKAAPCGPRLPVAELLGALLP
jgi:hypothetical protein